MNMLEVVVGGSIEDSLRVRKVLAHVHSSIGAFGLVIFKMVVSSTYDESSFESEDVLNTVLKINGCLIVSHAITPIFKS